MISRSIESMLVHTQTKHNKTVLGNAAGLELCLGLGEFGIGAGGANIGAGDGQVSGGKREEGG